MKKYEYKIVSLSILFCEIEEELNRLGEEGWEVYFVRKKEYIENPFKNVGIHDYEMINQRKIPTGKCYDMEFYLKRIKED